MVPPLAEVLELNRITGQHPQHEENQRRYRPQGEEELQASFDKERDHGVGLTDI